ncbi:unnamed protein product [Rangifer tarandus platyrhynchus]|uniref:Uncharacterized protein n=2 Tax=Rangifer tarandus platyrhynchus TaxID=3082113 RepID=A0ACB0EK28_RANTA|nr:unnamed protein product [Rangifer tarandus platyrhynchus]CAI9700531.1 unnamed protein product [Rangifer tarandus platyrhynchus]
MFIRILCISQRFTQGTAIGPRWTLAFQALSSHGQPDALACWPIPWRPRDRSESHCRGAELGAAAAVRGGPGPRLAGLGTNVEKRSPVSMELEWRSPWGQRPPPPWGTRGTQSSCICCWEHFNNADSKQCCLVTDVALLSLSLAIRTCQGSNAATLPQIDPHPWDRLFTPVSAAIRDNTP